jgi:hypothetical protein
LTERLVRAFIVIDLAEAVGTALLRDAIAGDRRARLWSDLFAMNELCGCYGITRNP